MSAPIFALLLAAGCAISSERPPSSDPSRKGSAPPPVDGAAAEEAPLLPGLYGPDFALPLTPLEAEALEIVGSRAAPGSPPPRASGTLVLAARLLAQRAAAGAKDPLDRGAVRDAQARALSYDPSPSAFLLRPVKGELEPSLSRALGEVAATHAGAGVALADDGPVVVVLTARRRIRLDPFPRELPEGGTAVLSGKVLEGLKAPRVFLTLPSGTAEEVKASGASDFKATVSFPERGRYLLEVEALSAGGPSVAALMVVAAGGAPFEAPRGAAAEEAGQMDPARQRALVLPSLDALRARHGLPPLILSADLSLVALGHSAAMRAAGRVAHLVPGSPGPADRLLSAGIAYRRVLENVASARTALAAQEAAAESPAHLKNMLEPSVSLLGLGIAEDELQTGDPRVYLTEIFVEPPLDERDSPLTLDAQVREALWRERARQNLAPLTADATLDELARKGAVDLMARDARTLPDTAEQALSLRRSLAAADAFVASVPADATRSRNLKDPRFKRVGVGVVKGTSRRFGAGRLFIAVVYTD